VPLSDHQPSRELEVFTNFALALAQTFDRDELLQRLLESVNELVDDASSGIMLATRSGDLEFAAASDESVVDIELHQARVKEGACYAAFQDDEVVAIPDVSAWEAWPEYRRRVLASGKRAVVGVPMHAFGETIGVINVYRSSPGKWHESELVTARAAAAIAATAIVHTTGHQQQTALRQQLESAIESRDLIGQAKGILMARYGIDSDAAFDQLRERSQRANRKLRHIAEEVVDEAAGADSAAVNRAAAGQMIGLPPVTATCEPDM
jgi:GAF domain-containing protein